MRLALAATLLLLAATPALAGDKAAGWAKWVERAERIEAAMLSGEQNFRPQIKLACNGVTGTVIGQGFQFPYWAQSLIQVCTTLKDDAAYGNKHQCRSVKSVIANLRKAEPVPEAPRAEPIARNIAEMLQIAYDQQCRH
jgi:hypothetical protein